MRPHGSVDTGSRSRICRATGLNCDGSMRLPTNGAPRLTCVPLLHWGEATVVKSPARIAAVGTIACRSDGVCRLRLTCTPPKKNIRFFMTGPPSVPPNWLRLSPSLAVANLLISLKRESRRNSNIVPWNALVPDLVTALTVAPV